MWERGLPNSAVDWGFPEVLLWYCGNICQLRGWVEWEKKKGSKFQCGVLVF